MIKKVLRRQGEHMEKIRLGIIGGGIGSYIGKAHRIAACMDENYNLMQVLKPGYRIHIKIFRK